MVRLAGGDLVVTVHADVTSCPIPYTLYSKPYTSNPIPPEPASPKPATLDPKPGGDLVVTVHADVEPDTLHPNPKPETLVVTVHASVPPLVTLHPPPPTLYPVSYTLTRKS